MTSRIRRIIAYRYRSSERFSAGRLLLQLRGTDILPQCGAFQFARALGRGLEGLRHSLHHSHISQHLTEP